MKSRKSLISLGVSFGLLVIVALGIYNRQAIYDWARLRKYVPSQQVVSLAVATTMNDTGKHLFYVNWPELQDKTSFNQSCTESEQSIVLGCYIQRRGIYLLDVKDDRLAGIEEVTAAHEMLHAAYDRLSDKDRARVDQLTEEAFLRQNNERIIKTVEAYRAKDASVVANELHSIIGTEVRDIPQELESYYKKYFNDRLKIIDLSEKYEKSFTELESQAKLYKQQLDDLKSQIDAKNKQLEVDAPDLANEYKELESQRDTANPASFNVQVRIYNEKVAAYNSEVGEISNMIDQYNQILEKYNGVVVQETELINAIDSRPKAIQSQ